MSDMAALFRLAGLGPVADCLLPTRQVRKLSLDCRPLRVLVIYIKLLVPRGARIYCRPKDDNNSILGPASVQVVLDVT